MRNREFLSTTHSPTLLLPQTPVNAKAADSMSHQGAARFPWPRPPSGHAAARVVERQELKSLAVNCTSNLKQMGIAHFMYVNDFGKTVPYAQYQDLWMRAYIEHYAKVNQVRLCPAPGRTVRLPHASLYRTPAPPRFSPNAARLKKPGSGQLTERGASPPPGM